MKRINILTLLPSRFLAPLGKSLIMEGISEAQAIRLVREREVCSFVRHASVARILSDRLGVAIAESWAEYPSPFEERRLSLVCFALWELGEMPRESVKYQLVYDGTPGILEVDY